MSCCSAMGANTRPVSKWCLELRCLEFWWKGMARAMPFRCATREDLRSVRAMERRSFPEPLRRYDKRQVSRSGLAFIPAFGRAEPTSEPKCGSEMGHSDVGHPPACTCEWATRPRFRFHVGFYLRSR